MTHLFLDDPNALLDPSLRLALLLQAQEAVGLPDSTTANTNSAGHHGDQADAMTMQLIQDMFLADLVMTQEEEQLRRDKALAEQLQRLDQNVAIDDRVFARIDHPMALVQPDDLPLYSALPAPPAIGDAAGAKIVSQAVEESDEDLPPLVDKSDDDMPLLVDGSDEDLPPLVNESDQGLPPLVDESDEDLPPLVDETDEDLPPLVDCSDDDALPLVDEGCGSSWVFGAKVVSEMCFAPPAPSSSPSPITGECIVCSENVRIRPFSGAIPSLGKSSAVLSASLKTADADGVMFPSCKHMYCASCLLSWIESTVNDRTLKFPTTCAHDGCAATLTGKDVASLLAGGEHRAVREKYLQRELEAAGRAVYCPQSGCGTMNVIDDPEQLKSENDPVVFCTECDEGICFRCRVADHYPMSCAEYQALPAHERDPEDVALHQMAQINQWKRCPSCRAVVERKDGCNFMMCLCGSGFCFKCGTPYLDLTATVEHQHGRPGCTCLLFDVPDEPAPAVVNAPARVHRQIEYAIGALHGLQVFDADPAPRRVPEPWPRGHNGRRRMACGHGDVLHPDDQTRRLPAWLATTYRDFVCHYCWREFGSWGALANHLHTTNAHAVLMCCNRTFKNEEGYLNHLDSVHDGYADNFFW